MITNILNIVKALPLLKQFLSLWGEVASAVKQVEQPGVSGADKKALALKVVNDLCVGIAAALSLTIPTASIVNIVGILIDSVVYVENALGRFTHAAPVMVAAAPLMAAPVAAVAQPAPTYPVTGSYAGPVNDPSGVITAAPPNPMNVE
jgi:hypothetical protein